MDTWYSLLHPDDRAKFDAAFDAHLFLSADPDDVRKALENGVAAATILPSPYDAGEKKVSEQLRIAFDGDAVLFGEGGIAGRRR